MAQLLPALLPDEADNLCFSKKYEHLLLAGFDCWGLYLNANQFHLGRAYAWLRTRHVDMHQYSDLEEKELLSLQSVISGHHQALAELGLRPDLINCEWLGNEISMHRGHGHMHLIPRYQEAPRFMGEEFPDVDFGRRSSYGKRILPDDRLTELVHAYREAFQRL